MHRLTRGSVDKDIQNDVVKLKKKARAHQAPCAPLRENKSFIRIEKVPAQSMVSSKLEQPPPPPPPTVKMRNDVVAIVISFVFVVVAESDGIVGNCFEIEQKVHEVQMAIKTMYNENGRHHSLHAIHAVAHPISPHPIQSVHTSHIHVLHSLAVHLSHLCHLYHHLLLLLRSKSLTPTHIWIASW